MSSQRGLITILRYRSQWKFFLGLTRLRVLLLPPDSGHGARPNQVGYPPSRLAPSAGGGEGFSSDLLNRRFVSPKKSLSSHGTARSADPTISGKVQALVCRDVPGGNTEQFPRSRWAGIFSEARRAAPCRSRSAAKQCDGACLPEARPISAPGGVAPPAR